MSQLIAKPRMHVGLLAHQNIQSRPAPPTAAIMVQSLPAAQRCANGIVAICGWITIAVAVKLHHNRKSTALRPIPGCICATRDHMSAKVILGVNRYHVRCLQVIALPMESAARMVQGKLDTQASTQAGKSDCLSKLVACWHQTHCSDLPSRRRSEDHSTGHRCSTPASSQ